jgi:hypothetical protein
VFPSIEKAKRFVTLSAWYHSTSIDAQSCSGMIGRTVYYCEIELDLNCIYRNEIYLIRASINFAKQAEKVVRGAHPNTYSTYMTLQRSLMLS